MCKRILLLLSLFPPIFFSGQALARDKAENWIEVSSPHFIVATNSSEKDARKVADQFERMRSVFHALFPKLQIDPDAPIVVLAIKDEKDFRALEPEAYLAKGSLKLGGLFLRAQDKNYVLMRLNAEGEHPYSVVYHEYTHLLLSKGAEWLPLWLNEGLAEFYQNTDIHEKDVQFGEPSADDILFLRQQRLLPLPTLFAVDANSPYYHEENKGSIFYSESWALVHFIMHADFDHKTNRLQDYGELLGRKVDPVTAATTAFGDLKQFQQALDAYVAHGQYQTFTMKTLTQVDDSTFKTQPLTGAQADSLRADFLAYNQRTKDARALLDHVLQEDPKNLQAHETMGFMEFQEHHLEEAKKWYAQAVQLDSQSYLAHYYFAAISMQESLAEGDAAAVETSLRKATQLNPNFAPAFDRLAVFLGQQHRDLNEARMMGLTAITLDPSQASYRVNVSNVLMEMGQTDNAVRVLQAAEKVAKNPQESQWVESALMRDQEFAEAQKRFAERQKQTNEEQATVVSSGDVQEVANRPRLVHRDFISKGPHRFVTGVLQNVHCDSSSNMDLAVKSGAKILALHTDNYYKIPFSALGFQPSGDLKPCSDLEGRPAKVEYVESANQSEAPHVVSIELHK
ncbi:MAG TPA: hypothetical protein VJQ59_07650 [Candidatus Sulfotelmatobacter sp.]|nr:hypothetical protein [Candidatus Sulfotelmatobacter sp.]